MNEILISPRAYNESVGLFFLAVAIIILVICAEVGAWNERRKNRKLPGGR